MIAQPFIDFESQSHPQLVISVRNKYSHSPCALIPLKVPHDVGQLPVRQVVVKYSWFNRQSRWLKNALPPYRATLFCPTLVQLACTAAVVRILLITCSCVTVDTTTIWMITWKTMPITFEICVRSTKSLIFPSIQNHPVMTHLCFISPFPDDLRNLLRWSCLEQIFLQAGTDHHATPWLLYHRTCPFGTTLYDWVS